MTVITAYLLGLATLPAGAATVWLLHRLFRREAWLCPYCLAWTAHAKGKPDTALYLPAILTWASVLIHSRTARLVARRGGERAGDTGPGRMTLVGAARQRGHAPGTSSLRRSRRREGRRAVSQFSRPP